MSPEPNLVPGWRFIFLGGVFLGVLTAVVGGLVATIVEPSLPSGLIIASAISSVLAGGIGYRMAKMALLDLKGDEGVIRRAAARDTYEVCLDLLERYDVETVIRKVCEKQHAIDMELGGAMLSESRADGHLPPGAERLKSRGGWEASE